MHTRSIIATAVLSFNGWMEKIVELRKNQNFKNNTEILKQYIIIDLLFIRLCRIFIATLILDNDYLFGIVETISLIFFVHFFFF